MPNADKRNGFNLITSGGRQPRRVRRAVIADNPTALFPGDAYKIHTDGNARPIASGAEVISGIVEAIDLQGILEGPQSYDYLPALTAGGIIGIEDDDVEFEVTITTATIATAYDAGAEVDIDTTTAGSVPLRQSRNAVGTVGGDQLRLLRPVDRPDNDDYAQFARVVVKLKPASVQ